MLLRNIDQFLGLCNGTRLIITKMGKYVDEGNVISGSNIEDKVFIPILSLIESDVRVPFKFQRRQNPLVISFTMIINKSQCQNYTRGLLGYLIITGWSFKFFWLQVSPLSNITSTPLAFFLII